MTSPVPLIRPNDKELLLLLIAKIMNGYDDPRIPVININDHEPRVLPGLSGVINSSDREWYFFRPRQEINRRKTDAGYWKVTGYGSKIKEGREEIGTKTILVYHEGRTPTGVRTRWIMHEYDATCFADQLRTFILCKVMYKSDDGGHLPNYNECETVYTGSDLYQMENYSTFGAAETNWFMNFENQATIDGIPQQEGNSPELAPFPESIDVWNDLNYTSDWPVPAAEEQSPFYDKFGYPMFYGNNY
ncbi:hypothetical protein P3X46_009085 [Hevea brasiliensis]|uniref:NAC domain-containing protein n=2 Tax=Hevea brasiliensis TaxID=3981 RepID=A0ABQ9MN98_HEVBR|nr:protein NTM1-like 9 [Hevea brasiliensis]KAJ9180898.1 hypothetical protein P3X46_009085 [Hevea brasiliensis]